MEPPRYRLPAMPRQPCRKRENADPATGRRLEVGSVRTLLLSTCLAASLAAAAPGAPTGSASLSAADRQGAVEAIATLVSKHYVFPEKRAAIVAAIQEQLRSGAYDGLDGPALSARLTDDLRHAGQDGHLWVKWSPEVYEARRKVKPGVESTDLEDAMGLRLNQGYTELKILDGNVRYVKLDGFIWKKGVTPQVVADVARFLGGGDAAIIDLRQNGGGSGEAVQALVSYFLPPDGQLLMTFHDGMTGKTQRNHVLSKLGAPRLVGKPLWVLISPMTASAAEEFSDHVKEFKLGTLVGRTTAGGANNNTVFPVAPGFLASVSTGRPVHGLSGTNWEGTGVPTDVDVPVAIALDKAHLLALQQLAARAEGSRLREYEWAMAGPHARLEPVNPTEEQLRAYAGDYGIRKIWLNRGALTFQREQREPVVLNPLGPDLFEFGNDPHIRLRFQREGGRITGFEMFGAQGEPVTVKRTG